MIRTKSKWKKASKCRIYLQALTVADISTADGILMEKQLLKGVFQRSRARNVEWPYQQKLKDSEWRCWKKVFLLNNTGQLRMDLGNWIVNTNDMYEDQWEWWLNNENNMLHRYRDWETCAPLTQRSRRRVTKRVYK